MYWIAAILLEASSPPVYPVVVYSPTGSWSVNGEDGRCVLTRSFITGADKLEFVLEALPAENLVFAVKDKGRTGVYSVSYTDIVFGADKRIASQRMIESFDSSDNKYRLHRGEIDREELTRAVGGGRIELSLNGSRNVRIEVPGLGAALTALYKCEDLTLSKAAAFVPGIENMKISPKLITVPEYSSPNFVRLSETGDLEDIAIGVLGVSPKGVPTSCVLVHRATSALLNDSVCKRGMKDRFSPAKNSEGKSVAGTYFITRRWDRFAKSLPRQDEWFFP